MTNPNCSLSHTHSHMYINTHTYYLSSSTPKPPFIHSPHLQHHNQHHNQTPPHLPRPKSRRPIIQPLQLFLRKHFPTLRTHPHTRISLTASSRRAARPGRAIGIALAVGQIGAKGIGAAEAHVVQVGDAVAVVVVVVVVVRFVGAELE